MRWRHLTWPACRSRFALNAHGQRRRSIAEHDRPRIARFAQLGLVVSVAWTLAAVSTPVGAAGPDKAAAVVTQTFTFTGRPQLFHVPQATDSLHIVAVGGHGGRGGAGGESAARAVFLGSREP